MVKRKVVRGAMVGVGVVAVPNRLDPNEKTIIGTSVCLVPLSAAARFFPRYTRRGLLKLFRALGVPILCGKEDEFFNLYALEEVLHYLMRPRGPGFAAPGSRFKNAGYHKLPELACTKTSITPEDLQEIASPSIRRQRMSTGLNAYSLRTPAGTHRSPSLPFPRTESELEMQLLSDGEVRPSLSICEGDSHAPGHITPLQEQGLERLD